MADSTRIEGERVFCHQCNNEWERAHGGLTCPRCDGDFTEIIEPSATPFLGLDDQEPSLPSSRESTSPPLHPFMDHNPWHDDPDTDPNNNVTTFEFTSNNGGGRISFSTRSFQAGGVGRNTRSRASPFDPFSPFDDTFQPRPVHLFPRDPHAPVQPGNLQDMFSLILQSMQPAMVHPPDMRHPRNRRPPDAHPFDLLNQLFNPANAQHGDFAFTQEAFDRVLTQLMEQNHGGNAPPPASEAAIKSLDKKQVDKEMLGSDGKAECSICMDNVDLGDTVTVLPCKHWFHTDCVVAWLKEHDTCPHCRQSVTVEQETPQSASRRRYGRRASSVSSPRPMAAERSQSNPVPIPESPSELRDVRQSYYAWRRDVESERPAPRRQSRSQGDVRRYNTRRTSANANGDGSSSGGVTGWIRDHLPFS